MPPHSSHLLQPLDISCFALNIGLFSILELLDRKGVREMVQVVEKMMDKSGAASSDAFSPAAFAVGAIY